MPAPAISVIMAAYNHERFVGAAIESVLKQTCRDFELIVIDDGSTDGTAAVVKRFSDPRLQYHYQANQDAFTAFNKGFDMARGKFFTILNSDDVYALNRLERLVSASAQAGAVCLFTDIAPIDEHGREIPPGAHYWHRWHARNRQFFFECGDLYTAFLRGNLMVATSNLFLTAEAARTVGPFASLRYLHDYDFIFRAMLAFPSKVRYLHDEKLLYYRIHGGNTISQDAVTAREQDRMVIDKYMKFGPVETAEGRAAAGAARLKELEKELAAIRRAVRWPPFLCLFARFATRHMRWAKRQEDSTPTVRKLTIHDQDFP